MPYISGAAVTLVTAWVRVRKLFPVKRRNAKEDGDNAKTCAYVLKMPINF